jgi:hypothetical protein
LEGAGPTDRQQDREARPGMRIAVATQTVHQDFPSPDTFGFPLFNFMACVKQRKI